MPLVRHGLDHEIGHQGHDIARGEVLSRLFVVLFVEAPEQLLEHGSHRVVVEARLPVAWLRAEVNRWIRKSLDQRTKPLLLVQARYLMLELKRVQDLAHIGREAVEVFPEIAVEIGRVAQQPSQRVGRPVVEGETGGFGQNRGAVVLPAEAMLACPGVLIDHLLLGRLQQRIEPPDHCHRQDDIAIFPSDVDIPQNVVGDPPNEADNLPVLTLIHSPTSPMHYLSLAVT